MGTRWTVVSATGQNDDSPETYKATFDTLEEAKVAVMDQQLQEGLGNTVVEHKRYAVYDQWHVKPQFGEEFFIYLVGVTT